MTDNNTPTPAGRWLPDDTPGDTRPTRNLTIRVPARSLTNPAAARHLADLFAEADRWLEHCEHRAVEVEFFTDLSASLDSYARELQHAHDELVRDVTEEWFEEDDGAGEG